MQYSSDLGSYLLVINPAVKNCIICTLYCTFPVFCKQPLQWRWNVYPGWEKLGSTQMNSIMNHVYYHKSSIIQQLQAWPTYFFTYFFTFFLHAFKHYPVWLDLRKSGFHAQLEMPILIIWSSILSEQKPVSWFTLPNLPL